MRAVALAATVALVFGANGAGCRRAEPSELPGDVQALVRELGLQRVVLNGWSLGGAVVVAAAAGLASPVKKFLSAVSIWVLNLASRNAAQAT